MDADCVCPAPARGQSGGTCSGGKKTRNAYLNFLRHYRSQHCGLRATEVVKQGAAQWRRMGEQERKQYQQMAASQPHVYHPRRFFGRRSSMRRSGAACPVGCYPAGSPAAAAAGRRGRAASAAGRSGRSSSGQRKRSSSGRRRR